VPDATPSTKSKTVVLDATPSTKGKAVVPATPPSTLALKTTSTYARLSAMMAKLPTDDFDGDEVYTRIRKALEADPRVPNIEQMWDSDDDLSSRTIRMFPVDGKSSRDALHANSDRFYVYRFAHPIIFSVRVPKKNQPTSILGNEPPAEEYYAYWDGTSSAVIWSQPTEDDYLPGGEIVIDVIRDACAKAGYSSLLQTCSAACHSQFLHTGLLCLPAPEDTFSVSPKSDIPFLVVATLAMSSPKQLLVELWYRCSGPIEAFATRQNSEFRIHDVEEHARDDLSALLVNHYEQARARTLPLRERMKAAWHGRGSARRSQSLIASIWLGLSNLELLMQSWRTQHLELSQSMGEYDLLPLFDRELRDGDEYVGHLDLSGIHGAVSELATRFDNRLLVWGTIMGAAAGGLAGALVTLLH
jgi:hypothetical protein